MIHQIDWSKIPWSPVRPGGAILALKLRENFASIIGFPHAETFATKGCEV